MIGLNENKLHHFGSPKFSPFNSCVVCRLPSYQRSEEVLNARETWTWEEEEVIDLEKEINSPEEEVAVEATADLPLILALAGTSLPPLLCTKRPVSSRGPCFGARREAARDKMTRLALTAN